MKTKNLLMLIVFLLGVSSTFWQFGPVVNPQNQTHLNLVREICEAMKEKGQDINQPLCYVAIGLLVPASVLISDGELPTSLK